MGLGCQTDVSPALETEVGLPCHQEGWNHSLEIATRAFQGLLACHDAQGETVSWRDTAVRKSCSKAFQCLFNKMLHSKLLLA